MTPLGDGFMWLAAKMSFVLLFFLWVRATFPRYRYDQVMRLGWKVFIPVTLVWIVFLGAMMQTRWRRSFTDGNEADHVRSRQGIRRHLAAGRDC